MSYMILDQLEAATQKFLENKRVGKRHKGQKVHRGFCSFNQTTKKVPRRFIKDISSEAAEESDG